MSGTITLGRAEKAIEAAKELAGHLGIAFAVSVVDAGAHLVALSRMDGAALAAVELSQAKARTAVLFGQPTGSLVPAVQPGAPMYGIAAGTPDPLAFLAGGIPVVNQHGQLEGAIGVGGGSPDIDKQIAEAALAAL